ncbi:MAG TPA: outer membrane beta-barrel protein [Rariglobus sp.]
MAGFTLLPLSTPSAWALFKFNEGRDQIYVNTSVSAGYDSNIFAQNGGEGDVVTNGSLGLEYTRHAGMIGVNGQLGWNIGKFASNASEDFSNPTLNLEFVKESGRTTGSFTLSATRQSQADPNVNERTDSWSYNTGLNLKYPVIERYSLAGSFGYGLIDYVDNSAGLTDLTTYTASGDVYYTYSSQRDIIAGYRIRQSDTSTGGGTTDHSFTAGVTGKILAKLKGTVRAGYQIREDGDTGKNYGSTTASASATWTVNKRFTLTGTLNKDFSTTASDSSVDTLSFNLDAQYALRNRWSLYSGIGVGYSDFLNGGDAGRTDRYFTWSAGVNYSLNEHFKASLTYSYFQNWSTRDLSNFDRNSITLNLSSRW